MTPIRSKQELRAVLMALAVLKSAKGGLGVFEHYLDAIQENVDCYSSEDVPDAIITFGALTAMAAGNLSGFVYTEAAKRRLRKLD